jgi:glycerophosphoryl diester phosphodiesterase
MTFPRLPLPIVLAMLPLALPWSTSMSTAAPPPDAAAGAFLVAHRGASAYAPEHTLAAYRLAMEQGADYVEQDLTLTKDGVLLCLHDDTLERTTDVEARFPDRAVTETDADGHPVKRWYANDFTLAEIETLDAGSWFDPRFAGARIVTLEAAIALTKGKVGIFPELKSPARLNARGGVDVERAVADLLTRHGLVGAQVKGRPAVYLQSFEEKSVRRLAEILPAVPRTFLIGDPKGAAKWLTPDGLREVKTFATAISPARALIEARPALVADAHAAGLAVVPYTFRQARGTGAPEREAAVGAMRRFMFELKVDGLFTDNPDLFPR